MSLRVRLALFYTSFFAVTLLLFGAVTYFYVRNITLKAAREEARVAADLLVTNYNASNQTIDLFFKPDRLVAVLNAPDLASISSAALFVQITTSNQIITSDNLRGQQLTPPREAVAQVMQGLTVPVIEQVQGTRLVSYLQPLRFRSQIVGFIQVARSLYEADRSLQGLLYALIAGSLIAFIAAYSGGLFMASAALQPIRAIAATAQGIMGARDLNQRVPVRAHADELTALTTTINDLLSRLESVFATQQQFVADVSHELRTPLAAMRGNLEVLQRGAGSNPALLQELLADMRGEVARMTRLVNDLLLLAQTEAGVELRPSAMELDTLLLEVYREWKPLAEGVALDLQLDAQVRLIADRDRIKQAVLNLVANALQHTPAGGRVSLGLRAAADAAVVTVRDTGAGIPAAALPHIFDRFFRADPARSQPGGAGLGLSIVHWIATAHGGTISVTSAEGAGTTFTLTLPLELAAPLTILASCGCWAGSAPSPARA